MKLSQSGKPESEFFCLVRNRGRSRQKKKWHIFEGLKSDVLGLQWHSSDAGSLCGGYSRKEVTGKNALIQFESSGVDRGSLEDLVSGKFGEVCGTCLKNFFRGGTK